MNKIHLVIPLNDYNENLDTFLNRIEKCTDLSSISMAFICNRNIKLKVNNYLKENKIKQVDYDLCDSVNDAIKLCDDKDICIIYPDVIVTNGWLDRLKICADNNKDAGIITPLFNYYVKDNISMLNIDEIADIVERTSLRSYEKIDCCFSKCLYLKSKMIDSLRKYYEKEVDCGNNKKIFKFSNQLGFENLLCDDVILYDELKDTNLNSIEEDLVKLQKIDAINNLSNYLKICNAKKNILYLLHEDFREDVMKIAGGTQLHVKDLVMNLRDKYNVYVACRDNEYIRVTLYYDKGISSYKFYIGEDADEYIYTDTTQKELYENILSAFSIDIVHIHHTLGLSLDLYYVAKSLNIPLFVTIHDFYYVCPSIKLLDYKNNLCIGCESKERCSECLNKSLGISKGVDFIENWRKQNLRALKLCDKIIMPSESCKNIFQLYYPDLLEKCIIIEHGLNKYENIMKTQSNMKKNINVAFIGGMSPAKGSKLAYNVIKNSPKWIRWHVFGGIGDSDLASLSDKKVVKTGQYVKEELNELIAKYNINIVCILPIWPETFCYTLSEAVLCGVPVIVTDIGAISDRVKKMQCGWIIPKNSDYKQLLEKITNIKNNSDEYNEKYNNIKKINIKSIEEMCKEYDDLYTQYNNSNIKRIKFNTKLIFNGCLSVNKPRKINEYTLEKEKLNDLQNEMKKVQESALYKVLLKIKMIKFPLRKQIKKILVQFLKNEINK